MKTLWNKYFDTIFRLYDKKIDATGLSIFRISYGFVMLCEVIHLYYFRPLLFDKVPFVEPGEIEFGPLLITWMAVLILFICGLFTRWMSIINYLMSLCFIATLKDFEYHMCFIYMGTNFLLMFVNTWQVNSLDRLFLKLRCSRLKSEFIPPTKVSVLNYYVLVLVSIAFVYFDSIFYKWNSPLWLKGLGMWLPASYPPIIHANTSFLLNIKWLSIFMGYVTLIFETIFILLFFRKKWRVPLMIVGILLHIGIFVEFPIPFFALGVISCYFLMVPNRWWSKLRSFFVFKNTRLTIFYNESIPFHFWAMVILKHLDWLNALKFDIRSAEGESIANSIHAKTASGKLIYGVRVYEIALAWTPSLFWIGILLRLTQVTVLLRKFYFSLALFENRTSNNYNVKCTTLVIPHKIRKIHSSLIGTSIMILCFLQAIVTYDANLIRRIRVETGFEDTRLNRLLMSIHNMAHHKSKVYLGITRHSVFLDYHFIGYNHIIGVEAEDHTGKKYWLPFVDRTGKVALYSYGMNWAKYGFRTNSAHIDKEVLRKGVRDFTAFWARKHGFSPKDLVYHIYVKKIDSTSEWQYDFLNKQEQKPWVVAGKSFWQDNNFVWQVDDIESI